MQSVTMQSEAARPVKGRSQSFNAGVTSAYGYAVNGVYRPYDDANGAQAVAEISQLISNMSSILQPVSSVSSILPPVSNISHIRQSVPNISSILQPILNVAQTLSFFRTLQQDLNSQCQIIQISLVIFRNWVLLEIHPCVLRAISVDANFWS